MIKFSQEKVLLLHKLITEETGGDPNVRDIALLNSALESAFATFDGKELYPTKQEKGARLGFAIADKEIVKDLEKIKYSTNPYNINRLTLILGTEAINDKEYFDDNRKLIIEAREYTEKALTKLGFEVLPSKTNFVFAKSPEISGEELYLKLKDKGILVRHFSNPKICEYNRITIGTMDEMKALVKAVEEIISR